ncbi:MAG: dynamin family protein [Paracoccaceae bacterium]
MKHSAIATPYHQDAETCSAVNAAVPMFVRHGLARFRGISESRDDLEEVLQDLMALTDDATRKKLDRLLEQNRAVQPSVAMIGQIKAGKTSLINAMIGSPGLLPADVNPWTSVITSLHINTPNPDPKCRARFQFFEEKEWDRLMNDGGRIGQLAARAGADDEVTKLRAQVQEMREKARQRLGRKFEMLLGQEHGYGYVDAELLRRYVCVGDDDDALDDRGRFADITKSADLYLERKEIPASFCLRDTPGVNDTFMIREQITINAVRDSRVCVIVLSAHQALTTTDMALIRIIASRQSRELLIFVNRIDELADPANQVPEIRKSIVATLAKNNISKDIDIVFGSANWANAVLLDQVDELDPASSAAAANWTQSAFAGAGNTWSAAELIWNASGIPALFDAMASRLSDGPIQEAMQSVARQALNLAQGFNLVDQVRTLNHTGGVKTTLTPKQLDAELTRIELEATSMLRSSMESAYIEFAERVDKAHESFLNRATTSLIEHVQTNGANATWHYSPVGLRLLLSSGYQVVLNRINTAASDINDLAASNLTSLYAKTLDVMVEGFQLETPAVAYVAPPVSMTQTIALDLQMSWWKSWWQRRKGYESAARDFYKLIQSETDPIVTDLKVDQMRLLMELRQATLDGFLKEQRDILMSVQSQVDMTDDDLKVLFGIEGEEDRLAVLEDIIEELLDYAQ